MNIVRIVNVVNRRVVDMGSPLERREREKAELRTKILDAARELFVTEGYEAVTMRKVAEKVEYSPTAIYLHFEDKDALIRALCTNDFESFAAGFLEIAQIADPVERLRRAGDIYVAFGLQHPQQYRLMFMAPRPSVDPTEEERTDPARNAYVFLRGTVEQAISEGRFRSEYTDAELVAQTIWASVHGVVSLEIAQGCEKGWVNWRPVERRAQMSFALTLGALLKDASIASGARRGSRQSAAPKPKPRTGRGR
jgi:AcrR family transcriptional regulator